MYLLFIIIGAVVIGILLALLDWYITNRKRIRNDIILNRKMKKLNKIAKNISSTVNSFIENDKDWILK